ncbi:Protein-tyrosine phosphatase [Ancylostoma caninum]|uniref:Protein-tyrosine phosphatase n=1 Tax=Ancylostoma caninum TaxID=29170 RepID=A0A368G7M2_ANCCA|nr:Protein-tyrosine phosphatase [Ancylostoma caninum]
MENTIGDFWLMVWQEKVPYIFMLTGRKEKDRCADYWPRRPMPGDVCGLHFHKVGISSSRDPMFRVTYIRIIDDFGEEHPIQKAVHFLRRQRPFSVETLMQFIFIHRCVQKFFSKISGPVCDMGQDYKKWLTERAGRMFVDNWD